MSYDYEYVEAASSDRSALIDALIATAYTKDAEIALINNEIASPGTAEYAAYQAYRQSVKAIVDEALGPGVVAEQRAAEDTARQATTERLGAAVTMASASTMAVR